MISEMKEGESNYEHMEAIAKRVSVRAYKPEQIPEDALQAILKAGMAAPVGSGAYDTLHLTVIQDMALLNEIGEAVNELVFKVLGKKFYADNKKSPARLLHPAG